jgi:ferredoxin
VKKITVMRPRFFSREHARSSFVKLDTHQCRACWKCLEICPNQVPGKIDLPWHKHALIVNADRCIGCLKCLKVCPYGAYSQIDKTIQDKKKHTGNIFYRFLVNSSLLISGLVMVFSGLALQLGFHIGNSGEHSVDDYGFLQSGEYVNDRTMDLSKLVFGFNYPDWSIIHKFAIGLFSLFMVYHISAHWKWYKGVISRGLLSNNAQLITLSVIFVLVAITGLVPWFIDLSGSSSLLRLLFIEIHDKLALVLIIYLILHVIKRAKWFF